jgi:hypothetical protein
MLLSNVINRHALPLNSLTMCHKLGLRLEIDKLTLKKQNFGWISEKIICQAHNDTAKEFLRRHHNLR